MRLNITFEIADASPALAMQFLTTLQAVPGLLTPTIESELMSDPAPDLPVGARITTLNDLHSLNGGSPVYWVGAKYEFTGAIETVNRAFDDLMDEDDEKVLWVRRDDTNKLVSLTWADIQTHSLTVL